METEYTYLLHLLGAYLRQEPPAPADNVDWEKLLELARIHGVTGIVGYMGKKFPICPDPRLSGVFRSLCMGTISLFSRRHALALEMVEQLERTNIDHILMKGFILRDCYPVPELRTFTDIDLVIRPEDRQKSHELMLSLGFTVQTDWEPTYTYRRGAELYELHTNLMDASLDGRSDLPAYFADAWSHAAPVRGRCHAPEETFHFLYTLCHLAKHLYAGGAGLRMYLDAALFIHRRGKNLDWAAVRREMEELKLGRFLDTVLSCCESWFGATAPWEFSRSDATDELLTYTRDADLFGKRPWKKK